MIALTKSTQPVKEKNIKKGWHLIDARGEVLGRISSQIAKILQGKNKTNYSTNLDTGDNVVVINAKYIRLTGKKLEEKTYLRYSGYPGGLRKISFQEMLIKNPAKTINLAVSGMLPKNKLRDKRLARLYIFPDEKHTYSDKFQDNKSK